VVGAIVPHAGWIFSGHVAALAFEAIRQTNPAVDTFVIFGAAHRYFGSVPAVYDRGAWQTPLGLIPVDEILAADILDLGGCSDRDAHRDEHSIEVQVPFIQYLFPKAKIVPIIVPVTGFDVRFGTRIGDLLVQLKDKRVVCMASTDLTHYGPRYGFCPEGVGPAALQWASEVNDMRFIDLAVRMEADKIVSEAMQKGNACGPAAAAALIAAVSAMGRTRGVLLAHTTSNEVLWERFHQSSDEAVGYAAIVY
jgi:AmmeMemoRadiSam system protein B